MHDTYICVYLKFTFVKTVTVNQEYSISYTLNFTLNFKLYSFYNNYTRLQIGHGVILLGGESFRNMFGQEKNHWNFPWIKNHILLMLALGFEPTTSQSFNGGVNT